MSYDPHQLSRRIQVGEIVFPPEVEEMIAHWKRVSWDCRAADWLRHSVSPEAEELRHRYGLVPSEREYDQGPQDQLMFTWIGDIWARAMGANRACLHTDAHRGELPDLFLTYRLVALRVVWHVRREGDEWVPDGVNNPYITRTDDLAKSATSAMFAVVRKVLLESMPGFHRDNAHLFLRAERADINNDLLREERSLKEFRDKVAVQEAKVRDLRIREERAIAEIAAFEQKSVDRSGVGKVFFGG